MARKKNTVKATSADDIPETAVEEPGYCIGHFDKTDQACEMCEIQDECKQLTREIEDEDDKEEDDGEKEK